MGEIVNIRDFERKPKNEGNNGLKDKQNRAFWIGPEQTNEGVSLFDLGTKEALAGFPSLDTAPSEFCAPLDDPA